MALKSASVGISTDGSHSSMKGGGGDGLGEMTGASGGDGAYGGEGSIGGSGGSQGGGSEGCMPAARFFGTKRRLGRSVGAWGTRTPGVRRRTVGLPHVERLAGTYQHVQSCIA